MNVSGDTTSMTCSGWTAAGQTCSFEMRTLSQDCGFISDPVNMSVSLKSKFKGHLLSECYKHCKILIQDHQLLLSSW